MLHSHTYAGCNHTLKFCHHCDVVYCTKCNREWNNHHCNHNWWTYATTTTPAINPLTPYYSIKAGDSSNMLNAVQSSSGNVETSGYVAEVKDHKHE